MIVELGCEPSWIPNRLAARRGAAYANAPTATMPAPMALARTRGTGQRSVRLRHPLCGAATRLRQLLRSRTRPYRHVHRQVRAAGETPWSAPILSRVSFAGLYRGDYRHSAVASER